VLAPVTSPAVLLVLAPDAVGDQVALVLRRVHGAVVAREGAASGEARVDRVLGAEAVGGARRLAGGLLVATEQTIELGVAFLDERAVERSVDERAALELRGEAETALLCHLRCHAAATALAGRGAAHPSGPAAAGFAHARTLARRVVTASDNRKHGNP
jgi:hypothetical protein